jgi:hypothetical protein
MLLRTGLGPGCVSLTPQLKREQSRRQEFGRIPGNPCGISNRYFAMTFLSSSPSLSGRVGVKHFQTAPSIWCRCHSQGPRFSSGSALWPSHDGIRRMQRTNLQRRPCRKTYGRHQDSKRTRLIHRPCGDIAPPVGGIHVFSCRVLSCTTRCEIHERHKCALTARSLLFARSR